MTTDSSFLGLTLYDATTDASALFLDYRTDIAGTATTSNMNVIDAFASEVSGSISTIQENPPTYVVSGSLVSANTYGATVDGILSYDANMIIALRLDTTTDGTATININGLGAKTLQKVDVEGNLTNLIGSDMKLNRDYYYRYNGTSFVSMTGAFADQTSVNGTANNLLMISGCNVIVDSDIETINGKITGSSVAISTGLAYSSGSLILETSGISSGSYNKVKVDVYGRVTEGSALDFSTVITGSSIMSDTSGSIVKHNVSGVTSGSYNVVRVTPFGHITEGSVLDTSVLSDTSPQLGGNLDLNGYNIVAKNEPASDNTSSGIIISASVDSNTYGIASPLFMAADGHFDEASGSTIATAPVVALALESGTGTKNVLLHGVLRHDAWNWTTGPSGSGLIYLSIESGSLVQVKPSNTDNVIQPVGWALSDDTIYFCPSMTWITHT